MLIFYLIKVEMKNVSYNLNWNVRKVQQLRDDRATDDSVIPLSSNSIFVTCPFPMAKVNRRIYRKKYKFQETRIRVSERLACILSCHTYFNHVILVYLEIIHILIIEATLIISRSMYRRTYVNPTVS